MLRSVWKVLDESPGQRDIYLRSCNSKLLPMMFCSTLWVENEVGLVRPETFGRIL